MLAYSRNIRRNSRIISHTANTYFRFERCAEYLRNPYRTNSIGNGGIQPRYISIFERDNEKLRYLQRNFLRSPNDPERARKYFRELNRHAEYKTVVNLWNQYKYKGKVDKELYAQYNFAQDHLPRSQDKKQKATIGSKMWNILKNLTSWMILYLVLAYFLRFPPFNKKKDGKLPGISSSLGKLGLNQFSFDIKYANSIEQRLSDVKGIDEIRLEIDNLIKMIKTPEKYTEKGAKLHKGVLLFGKPGTGKTLLARAIAGEANVNFIYCTGSQFDEMFVGLGAKRVRELFAEAKKNTPCIIFIDEIDTLLNKSRRFGHEHSSNRATINQLLAELDGFEKTGDILVIGATNNKDSLDSAAIRPGRFDKKIFVPVPDLGGRTDIFDYYLAKIAHTIKGKKLARMTPGFTGADIENLVNSAICEAVHAEKDEADLEDFEQARDKIIMGIERKNLTMSEKDRINTAIHEAGHTVTCYFTEGAQHLYKATIVARGGSLGATYMLPSESDIMGMNKEKALAHLDICLGGHIAEKLFLGRNQVTSGCSNDLEQATKIVYEIIRKLGMDERAGLLATEKVDVSESMNSVIDTQAQNMIKESSDRVEKLLLSKETELRNVAKGLYHYDYLNCDEIKQIVEGSSLKKPRVRKWKDGKYVLDFDIDD